MKRISSFDSSERRRWAVIAAGVLTALVVQSMVAHLGPRADGPRWVYAGFALTAFAPLCFLLHGLVDRFCLQLTGLRARTRWVAASVFLAAGMLATWLLAIPVAPASRITEIVVEATGGKAKAAVSSEVWFRIEVDGVPIPVQSIGHDAAWSEKDGYLVSVPGKQPASAHWRGGFSRGTRIVFVSHPWSGQARVRVDGAWKALDLFNPGSTRAFTLDAAGATPGDDDLYAPKRDGLQRWIQLCDGLLIGISLAMLFAFCVLPKVRRERANLSVTREVVLHALPTIFVSTVLLGIFFPGLMSSDSADQWQQAGTGQFNDAHPLMYGLVMRMARAVWDTPGLVAYVQMLGFALAAGALVAVTRRAIGGPPRAGTVGAWLLALHPMVSLTGITLWKDVPYTAALVALAALLTHALFSGKPTFNRIPALASLVAIAFVCMAMRHNGPPVVLAAWALLWFMKRGERKQLAWGLAALLAVFAFYKGPLPSLLNATQSNAQYVIYSHHIAAHLAHGHRPEARENAVLAEVDDSPDWRYNCASGNPTLFDDKFNRAAASRHSSELREIWLGLAMERPDIELNHYLCVTSLVWRASEEPRWLPLYLYSYAFMEEAGGRIGWVYPIGDAGVREVSLFPAAAQMLAQRILRMDWGLFLRPAGFLYMLCFAVMVAWRRTGDARVLLLLAIPMAHSIVLMAASVAQDARYQLPVYVIALATLPSLLAAARRDSRAHEPDLQTRESSDE